MYFFQFFEKISCDYFNIQMVTNGFPHHFKIMSLLLIILIQFCNPDDFFQTFFTTRSQVTECKCLGFESLLFSCLYFFVAHLTSRFSILTPKPTLNTRATMGRVETLSHEELEWRVRRLS